MDMLTLRPGWRTELIESDNIPLMLYRACIRTRAEGGRGLGKALFFLASNTHEAEDGSIAGFPPSGTALIMLRGGSRGVAEVKLVDTLLQLRRLVVSHGRPGPETLGLVVGKGKGSGMGGGDTGATKMQSAEPLLGPTVLTFFRERLHPPVAAELDGANSGVVLVEGRSLEAWCRGAQADRWADAATR
jgi:hypothetical protein